MPPFCEAVAKVETLAVVFGGCDVAGRKLKVIGTLLHHKTAEDVRVIRHREKTAQHVAAIHRLGASIGAATEFETLSCTKIPGIGVRLYITADCLLAFADRDYATINGERLQYSDRGVVERRIHCVGARAIDLRAVDGDLDAIAEHASVLSNACKLPVFVDVSAWHFTQ